MAISLRNLFCAARRCLRGLTRLLHCASTSCVFLGASDSCGRLFNGVLTMCLLMCRESSAKLCVIARFHIEMSCT
jgi:hypothetical protein